MKKSRKVLDAFKVFPITPEFIAKEIKQIRSYVLKQIELVHNMENPIHQMIMLFVLIEPFAQEYANYPRSGEKKAFINFIRKFQTSFDYLDEVDPVTLYYDYEKELDSHVSLDGLSIGRIYFPMDREMREKAKEIVACINIKVPLMKAECIDRHRYVYLLYRLRSKLIHEMNAPFSIINESFSEKFEIPQYWYRSLVFPEDGAVFQQDDWTLHIPVVFIELLVQECIEGFLQFCSAEQRNPADNNKVTRRFYLSWYDY